MTLEITNVCATRGARLLFEGVTHTLAPGGRLHVTGPNGVGKTTFLEILGGLCQASHGQILWQGAPLTPQDTCLIGTHKALKSHLTPQDHLRFWHALTGTGAPPSPKEFEIFGLAPVWHTPVGTLSFGMQQRVALGRLLLTRAPLWLLDEPLVGLDAGAQGIVLRLLDLHATRGGISVFVSHTPLEASAHLALETYVPTRAHLQARLQQESDDVALFC